MELKSYNQIMKPDRSHRFKENVENAYFKDIINYLYVS